MCFGRSSEELSHKDTGSRREETMTCDVTRKVTAVSTFTVGQMRVKPTNSSFSVRRPCLTPTPTVPGPLSPSSSVTAEL